MIKKYSLVLIVFLCAFVSGYGQWTEDFESQTSGSYGSTDIIINGRTWSRSDAGNFGYANSSTGSKGFTINDDKSNAHITTPVLNTCGSVTFDYAYINGSSSNVFELQTSTDGTTFTTIDTRILGAASEQTYVNYSLNINSSNATTYVRILSNNQNAHLFIDNFTVTNYIVSGPNITATPTTIPDLDYTFGTGPSAAQSFTIEGALLTDDIILTPPTNYEISDDNSIWISNPLTIDIDGSSGTVSSTTIYVRLKSGLAINNYNESITATSTGATDVDIDLEGEVTPAAPINDACSGAINLPVTIGSSCTGTTYTNVNATNDNLSTSCNDYNGADVWFSTIVPASGELNIETSANGLTDCLMAAFSGTCGSLTELDCSDDDNGLMPEINLTSLTPGQTIYILVWDYQGNNEDTFDICVWSPAPLTPCVAPIAQPSGLTLNNITGSSIDGSFTATTADEYLVVTSTSSTLSGNPIDGTTYNNGDALGGGTVVQSSNTTTFSATGLSQTTQYYFFVFALNNSGCSAGPAYNTTNPLTGNDTTISGPCASESFNNSGNSSSYSTENWTGDNSVDWTATDSRSDQDLNGGEAIMLRNGSLTNDNPIPGGMGTITFDYAQIYSGTSTLKVIVNGIQHGGDIAVNSTSISTFSFVVNIGGNISLELENSGNRTLINNLSWTCYSATPEPEIEIQGNNTEIVDGANSPNTGDDTDFGNVAVAGGTNANIFTIYNTGTADLEVASVISDNPTEFAVSGITPNTIIAAGNNASFTITFDPSVINIRTATITVVSDDADEDPYTFQIHGNGTNSNLSTIIDNTNYSATTPEFNSNPEYINFINASASSTGKFIPMKLKILDGPDTDGFDTKLTDISFSVEDISNTNQLAMIKTAVLTGTGGAYIATATKVGSELVFSGLNSTSLTAADDGEQIFHLRVSIDETQVIDKTKLVFKVTSATADASGSSFTTADAGGAETDTGNNGRNRLNVTADRLVFTTQPSDTSVSVNMTPAPIVSLTDLYGNTDIDITSGTITMSSTGTPNTQPSATISNGQSVFNSVNHTIAGTNYELTANYSGWSVTSNFFNISNTASGSYRTTGSGNWLSNQASPAIWQRFNGSTWATSNSPSYNTSNNVYIRNGHTINSGGSFGSSVNMIINNGGTFNVNHPGTAGNLNINDGGNLNVNANFSINNSGTIEVQDNGNLTINFKYGNALSSLWNGTELFHPSSNLIFKDWDANDEIIPNNTDISTNTFGTYTAIFGNIIIDFEANLDASDDITFLDSGVNLNMAHGDLIFRSNDFGPASCPSGVNKFRISTTGTVTSGIGGDFIVEDGFTFTACGNIIQFKSSGTLNFTIKGNMSLDQATTRLAAGTNPNTTLNIEGNLEVLGGAFFDMQTTLSGGSNQTINLFGNLYATNSGRLSCSNDSNTNVVNNNFNFVGSSLQTIDVASTSASENEGITFNVNNGASVELINRDFELGKNSSLNVKNNGTLNFGFNGTTALNVTISGSQTGTGFSSEQASTLIVTSPDGINRTGNLGNVQTVASNRSFNQTANFYYIGKENQVTGNALTTGSSVKNVYAILDNNTIELRLTNRTGISDGGKLEIQQGIVIGEEAGANDNDFYGPNGQLIMTGGEYRISTITPNQLTDYLPQLRKYSSYSLTGGIIHLNGTGTDNTQILSGVPNYLNLSFSGSNILEGLPPLPPGLPTYKGISSAASVSNNITISEDAIVDVKNLSLGGSGTNLIMEDQSRFIMAGSGTKPDATGSYTLAPNTTIEFNNDGGLEEIRLSNPVPDYANIVVSGSNVGTVALGTGPNSYIQFQPNGSFMVTGTGTFKQSNTNGFSGLVNTSLSNTNNPVITLLDNSTIEYQGANQTVTPFIPEYKNVTISGTGLKSLGHATDILVGEDLNMVASTLTINTNEALTVDDGVIVTAGNLDIEDSGSLIQINDTDTNSGSVSMKRNASIRKLDYVYWSSPVEGFAINDVYAANTPLNRIYRWNPTITNPSGGQGNWVDAAGETMQRGVGYIVRGPESFTTTAANITATFNNGKPFNGLFTTNVSRGSNVAGEDDDWNLLGNPYPSAINALEFLSNTVNATYLDGFVNIWTHGNLPSNVEVDPFYDNFGSNYTANDYITHNGTGTTSGPAGFNGEIAAGQSFMVNMVNGGTTTQQIEFRNIMRDKAYDNSQFYRNAQEEEKHRIWLDLVSENESTTRVLVGYVEHATQQRDRLYDAITDNQNFYSLIDNKNFVIQGRALPFEDTDVIPLGLNLATQNNYSIGIAAIDGIFETEDQTIYLKDNLIGITFNLSENPYFFSSEAGVFNDRFEIVFRPQSLSIDENEYNNALTIIEQPDGSVKFNVSNTLEIKNVKIYDVLGKLIYNLKGNSSTETYNLDNLSQAAYVAKVTLSNDVVITKKAIKRN